MINDKGFSNQGAGYGSKTVGGQGNNKSVDKGTKTPHTNVNGGREPTMIKSEKRNLGSQGCIKDTVGK